MITFNEEKHEYTLDGKKLISVTQLMRKHGLAPNYDGVPTDVLKAKAERGTLIHAEIEAYNKRREIGFTSELNEFIKYMRNKSLEVLKSEAIVYNDVVAGTIDLVLNESNGTPIIADIKTTATLHKDSVSWQLSIYLYLFSNLELDIYDVAKGQAFHFDKDGVLNVVDIPLKPKCEVERLLDAERKGELYTQTPVAKKEQLERLYEVEELIRVYDTMKKDAEARAQKMREELLKAMEENAVKTFENERIKITYVDPSERTTIDSARLKKELPDIANKYSKTTTTKASLRITLKEKK